LSKTQKEEEEKQRWSKNCFNQIQLWSLIQKLSSKGKCTFKIKIVIREEYTVLKFYVDVKNL